MEYLDTSRSKAQLVLAKHSDTKCYWKLPKQADMFQPALVSDFILAKDRILAEPNLDAESRRLRQTGQFPAIDKK
jgi:hypothetical protein